MLEFIMIQSVIAMAPAEGEGPGGPLGNPLFLIIMIFVLFYFILYRPEKKRKQEREAMLKNLNRGDEVITAGGVYGKITALTDKTVTVEVAPNTRLKVSRQHVSKAATENPARSEAAENKKEKKK